MNIGDVAHTPGVLALLERHLPSIRVSLWPRDVNSAVVEMLQRRFPHLKIIANEAELDAAFADCDFLLHGSGPNLVGRQQVRSWVEKTGKAWGVFGITYSPRKQMNDPTAELLSSAAFVFFRDSVSLHAAREAGCRSPVMEFGPDGAFAADIVNDAAAEQFLAKHGLEAGSFVCCIPRLRYTPYWRLPSKKRKLDPVKNARNEEMKEHDHAPLRAAIRRVVQETELKVLLCPEDATQMEVGREMILKKLPTEVAARVVWREDFWLTDEALGVYRRSAGLFGNEMHSPIMCIGNGIPAIVCRFSEQTSKGIMWRDIGLGDWLFDLDQEDERARIPDAVIAMLRDPAVAAAKVSKARKIVEERQEAMCANLGQALGLK